MRTLYGFFIVGLLGLSLTALADLSKPLSDQDLSEVSGQSGIALDLELRVNADESGSPLSSLNSCTGAGNPCLLAVQFNNRDSGGGEWLVLKDYYGFMKLNNFYLDSDTMPLVDGNYANPSRFYNEDGTACLSGGTYPNCNVNGSAAMKMSFPGFSNVFEDDIEWHLNIGRVAVQYGANGFLAANDNNKSFLGVRISDMSQTMARIDVDGSISLLGF